MSISGETSFLTEIAEALADRFEAPAFVVKLADSEVCILASARAANAWSVQAAEVIKKTDCKPLEPTLVEGDPTIAFTLVPGDQRVFLCVVPTDGNPPSAPRLRLLGIFAGVLAKRRGGQKKSRIAPPTPQPVQSAANASATLQVRYQKLLLLNRIAIGLFSGPTLKDSLELAAHGILALSGAKFLVLYRRSNSGSMEAVFNLGDRMFTTEEANARLDKSLKRLTEKSTSDWSPSPSIGWFSLPITGCSSEDLDGVLATGFLDEQPPSPDVQSLLNDVCRMLHNALRADRQLQEQETLAAVTEQSADPILMTDLNGKITAWSRGAEETFGYSASEVLNQDVTSLLVLPGQEEAAERIESQALAHGRVIAAEGKRRHRNGRTIDIEATYTVVKDGSGQPFGMVRILRDITRRKEIERMREEFTAMVTHDLRIPLTSIRGFSETMVEYWDSLPDKDKRKNTVIILRASKRMARLVDDFLDLSKLESGAPENPIRTPTKVAPLLKTVVDVLRGYGPQITFEIDAGPSLPEILLDPDQIERVLINLGGNAVKYSPDKGIVRLSAIVVDGSVEFAVVDQGPGIPGDAQKQLFDKFYRVPDEVSKNIHGTGLGLTVSKYIVEAHGGTIWVESELGRGSVFKFRIPLKNPDTSK